MPPSLDIYVITHARDAATLNRFVDLYVDREASDDREDEELMMVPLGTEDPRTVAVWEWEPARTLTRVLRRGLEHPRRAFAIYLKASEPAHDGAVLAFTTDDQTVLGLSIDDTGADENNLAYAKNVLRVLVKQFDAHAAFVAVEEPPPLSGERFPPKCAPTMLCSWKR